MWPWIVRGWVLVPVFGWMTGAHPRPTFVGYWVFWSLLVCAWGMRQPVQRAVPQAAWLGMTVWTIGFLHLFTGLGWTVAWMYQATLLLLAGWMLAERAEARWLIQALLWGGVGQGAVVLLTLWGVPMPWNQMVHEVAGTLHHRAALGVYWAACSLVTSGRLAWGFALLSALTGSWTGAAVALTRLLWPPVRGFVMLWPVALVGGLLATHRIWWSKLAIRVQEWSRLETGWLTGWGFRPFASGFVETDATGKTLPYLDYHNAFLDWSARTGVVGVVGLLALLGWAGRRLTTPMRRWLAGLAVWTGCWQSLEANPVFAVVLAVYLCLLCGTPEG